MILSRSQRWCLAVLLVPRVIFSFLPIIRIPTHHHYHNHPLQVPSTRTLLSAETASDDVLCDSKPASLPLSLSLSSMEQNRTATTTSTSASASISASTLSLLEHVNFNVPNHDYILDFYLDLLGCGLDPRVAVNLMEDNDKRFGREGLIWVSCGSHQFHFPRDTTAQVLNGHIGLRYKSLEGLKKRLMTMTMTTTTNKKKEQCFASYDIVVGPEGEETLRIQDCYGNVFHCREGPELCTQYRQSVLKRCDQDTFGDVALRYGIKEENEGSECRGIDHVELDCPMGTAEQIALFYESVFDATTMLVREENNDNNNDNGMGRKNNVAAYIAIGDIEVTTGRASQYLIFRETPSPLPAYDGHHLALYIGTHDTKNFERAFHKAQKAGLLSTNWRDKADVFTLEAARSQHQFRIETILNMNTGQPIFQLEHEIRSVEHPTWPGAKKQKNIAS